MTNLKDVLILDIECWSDYDIDKESIQYRADARIKYIGFYSYLYDRYDTIQFKGNEEKIKKFIAQHKVIVTFNGDDFDLPILKNSKNKITYDKWIKSIDLYVFLFGNDGSTGFTKVGKAGLMGLEFPSKSLRAIAETLEFETLKGDIDYTLFKKYEWTVEEDFDIKKYLLADIKVTKALFEKIYNFWLPFADFVGPENARKWRWLTSSIASIWYMYACNTLGREEIYNSGASKQKDVGGKVIEPRVLEEWGVWYLDVGSLYPHIQALFNLFSEVPANTPGAWHGNDVFKVSGWYDVTAPNPLCIDIMEKFKERKRLKKIDKKNPMVHALKILLNSGFGATYNPVFASMYSENCGHDTCWIGQQINGIMERELTARGYVVIAGDTDSNFAKSTIPKTREQVLGDLKEIADFINANAPFPQPTFAIEIENFLDYIMFVKDEKKDKTLKKNYVYVVGKEITVMGLPIIKSNASKLGPLIFEKYMRDTIIKNLLGKFEKKDVDHWIREELKNDITLVAQDYKVQRFDAYSPRANCIQKSISLHYLDKKSGVMTLIKNKSVGKIGTTWKYCKVEDAGKLTIDDLDLDKVYNELTPFIKQKSSKSGGINAYF